MRARPPGRANHDLGHSQGHDYAGEPTDDPVELERRRIAEEEEQRATPTERRESDPERWTLLRRLGLAICLGLVVGYLLVWARNVQEVGGPEGYIRGSAERGPVDFISTLTGALIIREGNGARLYDLPTQRDAQTRILEGFQTPSGVLPYNHAPFEALAVAPFMGLPFPVIFALWTLVAGVAVGMSLGMLDGVLPVARPVGWVLSMAACSYYPLIRGLMLGQNSALVLMGLCGVYVMTKRGESGWAGAALVLVALKPQVLPVVLLVLLLQKRWAVVGVFAGLIAALSVAATLVLGLGWPLDYVRLLLGVANWGDAAAINPEIMHNWRGFAANLFGPDSALVMPTFVLLSLVSVGVLVWAWTRTNHAAVEIDDGHAHRTREHAEFYLPEHDLIWALAGIVAVLTSLHLNPHDLTLLVLPAWIVGAYATTRAWPMWISRLWIALLWVGYASGVWVDLNATGSVVPSVLLLTGAAALLVWHLYRTGQAARAAEAQYA